MTPWQWSAVAASVLAVVPVGQWLLVQAARRWGTDDVPIKPPVRRPEMQGLNEALRDRAKARRQAVEQMQRNAARLSSGASAKAPVVPFRVKR